MKHQMPKDAALPKPARKPRPLDKGPATETVDLSLRLLERLARSREAIGVSELAREFASSKATIYRHLQALLMHSFVHQEFHDDALRRGNQAVHSRRTLEGAF